jgi:DNA-binding NarL/FixJ family response regulator
VAGVVLVVDDDPDFRACVVSLLEQAGYATQQAATGEDALRKARGEKPGLVLLDLDLPGVSGYEICRELREEFGQDVAIAFVTGARTEPLDRTAGLLLGADDYIFKPFEVDELLARVNALLRRVGSEVHERNIKGDLHLTERECEVLRLLAEGCDQTEIAHQLAVMPKTVGRHIEHILSKLNVHSRSQAIALAYRYGLFSTAHGAGGHLKRDGVSRPDV